MFRKQSRRLLKPGITSIEQLKQEVWAVFNTDDVLELDQPLVARQGDNNVSPITIVVRPDFDGNPTQPITTVVEGPPVPPLPPFPGYEVPDVPPWTNIPDVIVDPSGDPRPNPTIPGVPPLPDVPRNVPPVVNVPPSQPLPPTVPPGVPPTVPPPSSSGNAFAALVVNKVSGKVYSCQVFTSDPSSGSTLDCTAPAVSDDADLLPGTPCPGIQVGGTRFIYPAVFAEFEES